MSIVSDQADKRIRQKEATRFKGRRISHSEIVRSRGETGAKTLLAYDPKKVVSVDGGKASIITETPAYRVYVLFIAPQSSTGLKETTSGNQTILVNSGLLYYELRGKKRSGNGQLSSGKFLEIRKGDVVALSSNANTVECMIIESYDHKDKKISDAVSNETGMDQFMAAHNPGTEIRNLRKRKRKTAEEREAFGKRLQEAQGVLPPTEKATIQKDIARGEYNHVNMGAAVMGTNPQPVGDQFGE
jgi:quercetin dioxygenase-like cupin family protein